jgi:signal transduction histidine kinase
MTPWHDSNDPTLPRCQQGPHPNDKGVACKRMELRETAFMGKITANMTHEIRNVLAIIKESAGLMEDVLLLAKGDPLQQAERFQRMISKILGQVDRGTVLAAELSGFAHSADTRHAGIEVNELLKHLVVLYRRFARNRLVELELHGSDTASIITGDPLKIRMAICDAIDAALSLAPAVNTIILQPTAEQDTVCIRVRLEGTETNPGEWAAAVQAGAEWKTLVETCVDAGGSAEMAGEARWFELAFGGAAERDLGQIGT